MNVDFPTLLLPEMSIHRVCFPKDEDGEDEENLETVIRNYALEKNYEPQPIQDHNWVPLAERQGFQLLVFSYRHDPSKNSQTMATFVGGMTDQDKALFATGVRVDFLFFLYRTVAGHDDVYALTTGSAYRAIEDIADQDFPRKVAKRTVDPEGFSVKTERVTGNLRASQRHYRERMLPFERVVELIQQVNSTFKKSSSLYRLASFPNAASEIGVSILRRAVRVKKSLSILNLTEVIHHFYSIYKGELTQTLEGEMESDDPAFRALDNVRFVEKKTEKELDKALMSHLYAFFMPFLKGEKKGHLASVIDFIKISCLPTYLDYARKKHGHPLRHGKRVPLLMSYGTPFKLLEVL